MTNELATLTERRRNECAYTTPCKVCIHAACGSFRDQAAIDEIRTSAISANCPECGELVEMELSAVEVGDAESINVECPMCGCVFEVEVKGCENS